MLDGIPPNWLLCYMMHVGTPTHALVSVDSEASEQRWPTMSLSIVESVSSYGGFVW